LVATGVVAGWAGAALLTRLLSSFLYGVSAVDSVAFAAAGAAVLAVGAVAAFVPAWRAGMADPLLALREEEGPVSPLVRDGRRVGASRHEAELFGAAPPRRPGAEPRRARDAAAVQPGSVPASEALDDEPLG